MRLQEEGETERFIGPLGEWILEGMAITDIEQSLQCTTPTEDPGPTQISIHTIELPERAPKKLLLELKRVLESFPGKECVQLKIGTQQIPLSITVNMSTILENKIEAVMKEYKVFDCAST